MYDKRFHLGKYVINIKWVEDDYADLSWLGEMTDQRGEYCVDRKEGVLLGKYKTMLISVPRDGIGLADSDWYADDDPRDSAKSKAWKAIGPVVEASRIYDEDANEDYVEYDWRDETFYIELDGYEILADDLGSTMGWRERRYFQCGSNHLPHNPKNWAHVPEESIQETIDKHGSLEQADIQYALQDWKLYENFQVTWWEMCCDVTVEDEDGNELGAGSLCGVNSDCGDAYELEVETDCLSQALHEAGLTKIKADIVMKNYEADRYEEAYAY